MKHETTFRFLGGNVFGLETQSRCILASLSIGVTTKNEASV